MQDATVIEWLKSEGDRVEQGEVLVILETDKVNGEVESPASGVLVEIVAQTMDVVAVEGLLARVDEGA
jgi:pyruvate/2-oxoglutarate dehydrogenase complex dihydrolipoamide acyltransferase (E2) component